MSSETMHPIIQNLIPNHPNLIELLDAVIIGFELRDNGCFRNEAGTTSTRIAI